MLIGEASASSRHDQRRHNMAVGALFEDDGGASSSTAAPKDNNLLPNLAFFAWNSLNFVSRSGAISWINFCFVL